MYREPNATAQARLEAGAQRTLEAVACSGLLGRSVSHSPPKKVLNSKLSRG
jgi:hypothetical protein